MPRNKPTKAKRPTPDDSLAHENIPGLNEAFYRTEPHAYLLQRWHHLLLARGAGDKLDDLIREGIEVDGMKYGGEGSLEGAAKEDNESDRERFVIAEAEVLLHHVSETMLRLYLAHRGSPKLPPCPWLELARVRFPGDFKEAVEKLRPQLESGAEADNIRAVFYGTARREAYRGEIPDDVWTGGPENIAKYLDHYAGFFLAADSYNAAKHGLALLAGESSMSVQPGTPTGDPDIDNLLSASGPSIEYLAIDKSEGQPRWARKTKWININRSMALAWVGCQLINNLWQTARVHYRKQQPEGIRFFAKPAYEEVIKSSGTGEGIEITEMAMHLLYYEEPPNTS